MLKNLWNFVGLSLCLLSFSLLFGDLYNEQNTSIANTVVYNLVEGKPNLHLDPFSEQIGVTWNNGMIHDKPLIQNFYSLLEAKNESFVILDIGAQTGLFSLMAKFLPNSRWYSFEPIEEAAKTLINNLLINNIENVTVVQKAASNVPGKAILKLPPLDNLGCATLGANPLRFTTVQEREIDCIDLDGYVAELGIEKVDFIKIDTEGWELNVLRGAEKTILRDHPIILMEFNETNMAQCNIRKEDVLDFLSAHNYEWRLFGSEDILCTLR